MESVKAEEHRLRIHGFLILLFLMHKNLFFNPL
ncbi:hypothetical protein P615_01435 [Brevibacillus laterosporus PE36]|nr:hypothetical protein P615_01435 [Brevibacillus laterosporus PE36]